MHSRTNACLILPSSYRACAFWRHCLVVWICGLKIPHFALKIFFIQRVTKSPIHSNHKKGLKSHQNKNRITCSHDQDEQARTRSDSIMVYLFFKNLQCEQDCRHAASSSTSSPTIHGGLAAPLPPLLLRSKISSRDYPNAKCTLSSST
jgi:hypothetical protein